MISLAFAFYKPQMWEHIPIEDPRGRELADRHYSRQTPGAKGYVPGGQRFALLHQGEPRGRRSLGRALWTVCRNMDPVGTMQWRNTIFRNESRTLSSELIVVATAETFALWARRYHAIPPEDLTTEIDIDATASRRSRGSRPGRCYEAAGWIFVRELDPGHGRPARAIWKAPRDPAVA